MQVKNEETLLLLATYTKYSRKTHFQTISTTQVGQPPSNPHLILHRVRQSPSNSHLILHSQTVSK